MRKKGKQLGKEKVEEGAGERNEGMVQWRAQRPVLVLHQCHRTLVSHYSVTPGRFWEDMFRW